MNKIFKLIKFVILFLLAACGQVASVQPTMTESPAPSLTPTRTPLPSSTPRPTNTAIPTATEWEKTYPTKQALVIYGASSRNQINKLFMERGDFHFSPFLTLYNDGQLIFGPGWSERYLSPEETDAVLTKLDQMGFFQIQDTYPADSQNPIYVLQPNAIPNLNLPSVWITVDGEESKSIGYMQEWKEELVQPMKDIIDYLKSFSADGAQPYQPDRLLVGIETEMEFPSIHDETAIPWPDDITLPSQMSYDGVLYLEGAEALQLYEITNKSDNNIFIFDGIKFAAYLRPILPNECHIYHYYPDPNQPFFTCDDW